MSHDPHHSIPGYSPAQILVSGCRECAAISASRDCGLSHLDSRTFARAWERAAQWNGMGGGLDDVSVAEAPLLSVLWALELKLQPLGWPLGELPVTTPPTVRAQIDKWLGLPPATLGPEDMPEGAQ